jgi:hypothetical protein
MSSGGPPGNTTADRPDMRAADRFCDLDKANYNGPATIVTRGGEIEVIVYLRSGSDSDECLAWGGHIDCDDQGELDRALTELSVYGLVIRLPDGREGNFMPSVDTGIRVRGFMRG